MNAPLDTNRWTNKHLRDDSYTLTIVKLPLAIVTFEGRNAKQHTPWPVSVLARRRRRLAPASRCPGFPTVRIYDYARSGTEK